MKLRKSLRIAGWFVAGSLVLLGLALGLLQLSPVRSVVASVISGLASTGDMKVTVEGFEGWLPASPRVRRVTVADARGPWLVLNDIHVDWSPFSLVFGNIVASDVSVASVDWYRNPETSGTSSTSSSSGLPRLRIGQARVQAIRIDAAVAGIAGDLMFKGHCDFIDPASRAVLVAELRATGTGGSRVSADLDWNPDALGLRVNLQARDAAGGILTRLAGLPADAPLSVTAASRGTLDDWRADLAASAGTAAKATIKAAIRLQDTAHHIEARMELDLGDIGPGGLRRFIRGHSTLTLDATRSANGALRLNKVHVEAPAARLNAALETTSATSPLVLEAESDAFSLGRTAVKLRAVPDRSWFERGVGLALDGTVGAAGATARVKGDLDRKRFAGDLQVDVPDLKSLGLGDGTLALQGKAQVTFASQALALDATAKLRSQTAGDSAFDVKITGTVDTPSVNLTGRYAGQPLLVSAAVTRDGKGLTRLMGTRVSLGSVTLAGDLAINTGLLDGRLALDAGNMKDLSTLADLDMAGQAHGILDLTSKGGVQDARVTLVSPLLRLDTTTFVNTKMTGRVRDPFGKLAFDVRVEAPSIDADGFALDHVTAVGKGPLAALDVDASGAHEGAAITARGRLKVDRAPTRIALAALTMARNGHQAKLATPVNLTIVHGAVEIPSARLAAGSGDLVVRGKAGREMALTLEPRALPLWVADLLMDPLPVAGQVSGRVTLHGLAHDRLADFDVKLTGLAANGVREAPRNLVVLAKGTTTRSAVTFKADVAGARGANLHAEGRVPFDNTQALALDANGDADLSLANAWFGATGERATGRLSISAKVTGTSGAPRVSGTGAIHDGFFRSPDAGLEVRNIEARFEGSERHVVLASLTARAPNGGTVTAQGDITLDRAAGFPVNLAVKAARAQLVSTTLTTLTTALDAKVTGALLKQPRVSGSIDIARWDIRVPERLARPLTPIAVTHRNVGPGFVAPVEEEAVAPDTAFTFGLDLAVRAPREVFVRGQGIDAEFSGEARLTGTIDAPAVRGRFDLRRGSITLLSQRVILARGSVQFLGDIAPLLDIAGGVTKNGVSATVAVKGEAADPQITLTSVPSLPQDEILARLLFSKQTTQLSPFEAAELAQAIGKWSGLTTGPDILDRLRNVLGIDALSATTDDKGATAVNAGRYVGSGVFIGVSQASGGSATVDVDLSEDIKLRGEAGAKGTKVGVAAEWEY